MTTIISLYVTDDAYSHDTWQAHAHRRNPTPDHYSGFVNKGEAYLQSGICCGYKITSINLLTDEFKVLAEKKIPVKVRLEINPKAAEKKKVKPKVGEIMGFSWSVPPAALIDPFATEPTQF